MVSSAENKTLCDVVVVGGSAAGVFSAYLLAREGLKVKVFDAGDPFCSIARTLITTSHLSEILGFEPSEAIVNEISRIELFSPGRATSVTLRKPDLVVERAKIIEILTRKAAQAGAEIRTGCRFVGTEPGEDGVTFLFSDSKRGCVDKIKTTILIGADGTFSRVAKIVERDGRLRVPIIQAIVRLPKGVRPDTTQVWFDPDTTPYFYWVIPESDKLAAVGLIAEDGKGGKASLERFLEQRGLKPLGIQASRIPLYSHFPQPWRRYPSCDVYLVGDAAGQVKVTTVGGLVTGLWGAKAVAQAILKNGNYLQEMRGLRKELTLHLLLRSVLNRFSAQDYDRLLELLDAKTIHLLGHYTRDEFGKMVFKLISTQPRLLGLLGSWFLSLPSRVLKNFHSRSCP